MSSNVTKKDLVDEVVNRTKEKRVAVKEIIQSFLDVLIDELGEGRRIELRDFGVFEVKERAARIAQNPKTLEKVKVPPKRSVKFKAGRLMKEKVADLPADGDDESPKAAGSTRHDGAERRREEPPVVEVSERVRSSVGG